MVPPMTQLTIGSLLSEAPGFLNSLSYTVEESATWETRRGMQFPKVIMVSCDFRYIGKKLPSKYGQHFGYDQAWYRDNNIINEFDPEIVSLLKLSNKKDPLRVASYAANGLSHPDTLPGPSGNWGADAAAATTVIEPISVGGVAPNPGSTAVNMQLNNPESNGDTIAKSKDEIDASTEFDAAYNAQNSGNGNYVSVTTAAGSMRGNISQEEQERLARERALAIENPGEAMNDAFAAIE
jgi:hypothetical protein